MQLIQRLRSHSFFGVLVNFFNLSVFQGAGIVLQFLAIPLITHKYGIAVFGQTVLASSFAVFMGGITNYGTHQTAIKEVATAKDNLSFLSALFYKVLFFRSYAFLLTIPAVLLMWVLYPSIGLWLWLSTLPLILAEVFNPLYFLIGVQKIAFISWGNLVQLFVEDGEFDGNALDLLIQKIDKKFKHSLPEHYEMEYYVMDNEMFESQSCEKLVNLIDEYIERAQEEFSPEYAKTMDKLSALGLFKTSGVKIPGQTNMYIRVEEVDPETLKVKYIVGRNSYFGDRQYGLSTPNEVIAMATQPGLFNPTEFRILPGQLKR